MYFSETSLNRTPSGLDIPFGLERLSELNKHIGTTGLVQYRGDFCIEEVWFEGVSLYMEQFQVCVYKILQLVQKAMFMVNQL